MRTPHSPLALAAIAMLFATSCLRQESTLVTPPTLNAGFPSAHALNARLGRGINFGNALDAPEEGEWGPALQADWFRAIADSGFNTVRLPVRWSAHALTVPPYTLDSAFLERAAWAVDQGLAAKLHVILDMHHYDSLMFHPDREEARFLAMWRQIAVRFADHPPELILEILNEPREKLDAKAWNRLAAKAIDTIRVVQPKRTLVVGTAPWGGLDGLKNLELPADSNLIVTVHYYDPFTFTHQGAAFVPGADAWLGARWRATASQRAQVDQDVRRVRDWGEAHGRPIFMGEFGSYEAADTVSRALYAEYLASSFTQAGFSWAAWNFTSDFGIRDDKSGLWRAYLSGALLHPGRNRLLDSLVKSVKPILLEKYLVFDDFEDAHGGFPAFTEIWQAKLGLPIEASSANWYSYYSDTSALTTGAGEKILRWFETGEGKVPSNFSAAETDSGYSGRGLHVKAKLAGGNYPFVGFGAGLLGGWDSAYVDLTALTALQFRAKGRGEWYVQFISDSVYNKYPKEDNWGHPGAGFIPKAEWESFVIPAETFLPKKYSPQEAAGMTWEDIRSRIIAMEFMTGQSYGMSPDDSLELWIDEIRLIGVDKGTFGM